MGNSSSKQKLAIIVGAAAVGLGALTIITKKRNDESLQNSINEQSSTQVENKESNQNTQQKTINTQNQQEYDIQFINQINKELIRFEQDQTPLSLSTIIQIFSKGFINSGQEYAKLQLQHRIDRRKYINQPTQYVKIVMDFNSELEQLLTREQLQVCEKLRISAQIFESSFYSHMQNPMGQQQIMMAQLQLRQQLIQCIPSTKNISSADIDSALQVQMNKLDDVNYFKSYFNQLQQEEFDLAGILISALLSDQVEKELHFEEEDLMEGLKNNPQQLMSFSQIQNKVMHLMQQY